MGTVGGAGLVYLSSSGATCSTKMLGLGGVLRGKELKHLEGCEGGSRSTPVEKHQGEVVSE